MLLDLFRTMTAQPFKAESKAGSMNISDLNLLELKLYTCRQSAAVMRACNYVMPEHIAVDYLMGRDGSAGYRFDVLQAVHDCITFSIEHKRIDSAVKDAFENILIDIDAKHIGRLTDVLYLIAEIAMRDKLLPIPQRVSDADY